jgi:DNA-binding MarR family transcriptional regulator
MMRLGHLAHLHMRLFTLSLAGQGLTRGMPFVLHFLKENPGSIQSALARHAHMDPGSITSVLSQMESAGHIERERLPGDKRALQVRLTQSGSALAKLTEEAYKKYEELAFSGFAEEEIKLFRGFLERIEGNLKQAAKGGREKGE